MTREEAIGKLRGLVSSYPLKHDEWQAIEVAIETLKEQRPQWIPVSERLPEVYGVYLATNSEGDVYEYDYCEFTVHDGKWSFLGRDVIAWMPLPKPYKKEGEEK